MTITSRIKTVHESHLARRKEYLDKWVADMAILESRLPQIGSIITCECQTDIASYDISNWEGFEGNVILYAGKSSQIMDDNGNYCPPQWVLKSHQKTGMRVILNRKSAQQVVEGSLDEFGVKVSDYPIFAVRVTAHPRGKSCVFAAIMI